MYIYIHAYIHTCIDTCIHTYIHAYKTGTRGKQQCDLAEGMGDNKEREYNKRILPDSSGETTNENKLHTKPNENSNRPREHKIISTQV